MLAVIITAGSADTVRQTVSAAVGAWPQVRFTDCVVRAAVAPARVGHSSLGDGHLSRKPDLKHLVNELHHALSAQGKGGWIHDEAGCARKDNFFFDQVICL